VAFIVIDKLARLRNRFRAWNYDTRAAVELSRLGLRYVPWPAYSMRPAAVAAMVNEVLINARRDIVEFGCGVSTLYMAKALSMAGDGGHIVTFEDNADWGAIVEGQLRAEGLESFVTIVHAPLGACRHAKDGLQWYDEAIVAAKLADLRPDLVVVDGPQAGSPGFGMARYPALPMVWPRLAPKCLVALDDIVRPGEKRIVEAWKALPGFDLDVIESHAGYAQCWRGERFAADL
jgi:predicted O-methyltransferase YrrM